MNWIRRHRKLLALALLAVLALALFPALSRLTPEELLAYTPESPALAALVLVGMFWIKSVLMTIPLAALYIAAGFLFPKGAAILLVLAGLTGELVIGYFLGRSLGREQVARLAQTKGKLEGLLSYGSQHQWTLCFVSRLLPLPVPFDAVSMFWGATGLSLGSYLLLSLFGLCPAMIPFVLAGGALSDPLSPEFLLPFGAGLAASVASLLLLRRWNRRGETHSDKTKP